MEANPILPRPAPLSEPLLRKWLGEGGVERFRGAGNVQTGRELMLEAIEAAIRERFPDGNYPAVEELLYTGPGNGKVGFWTKKGKPVWDTTGQGPAISASFPIDRSQGG